MMIMIACALLLVAGLAAVVLRGGERFQLPTGTNDGGALPSNAVPVPDHRDFPSNDGGALLVHVARRVLWWANVLLVGGGVAGLCMAGAGGRLVMRLLAVTSPEDDGRLTDAGETIGEISLAGTSGFVAFGIVIGCATALLYGLVRWWLPAGRAGGAAFGLLLLLGLSTVFGPLEPDSRDFRVVGPGWLSIAAFSALAVAHGMLVATASAWLSRRVPLLRSAKDVRWYLPLLLVLVPLGAGAAAVAAWMIAAIVLSWAVAALRLKVPGRRQRAAEVESGAQVQLGAAARPGAAEQPGAPVLSAEAGTRNGLRHGSWALVGGRIALVALAVAWLPGFLTSMATIVAAGGP
ncbi:hypothetical protein [Arthrobacter sp.]|uniref:hypothetical protein n=1 Tax=Arthrobacter sp. TaxID=1667 RepID=UPI003390F62C